MKKSQITVIAAIIIVLTGAFIFLTQRRGNNNVPVPTSQSAKESSSSVAFQGHVAQGEKFQKNIGNGLIFQLVPESDDAGWNIGIVPESGTADYDFTLATPPFYGENPTGINGWDFDASSTVYAPYKTRDFLFVLNNKDANAMADAIGLFTSGRSHDFSPNVTLGKGELIIQNLKLGNPVPGEQAWIESMDFSVNLNFSGGTY